MVFCIRTDGVPLVSLSSSALGPDGSVGLGLGLDGLDGSVGLGLDGLDGSVGLSGGRVIDELRTHKCCFKKGGRVALHYTLHIIRLPEPDKLHWSETRCSEEWYELDNGVCVGVALFGFCVSVTKKTLLCVGFGRPWIVCFAVTLCVATLCVPWLSLTSCRAKCHMNAFFHLIIVSVYIVCSLCSIITMVLVLTGYCGTSLHQGL